MNTYTGYREVNLTDEEFAALYTDEKELAESCGMLVNEYLVAKVGDEIKEIRRFDGEKFAHISNRTIQSRFLGKVSPRNIQQKMLLDMLYNDDITIKMVSGKFGSGKTFLMSSAAVDMCEKHKYDRIVYVRNNIEVKHSKPLGFLPGSFNEKLLPFAMPLADHLGGADGLELMIKNGTIEIAHLGFIRGRDIKNSIILCSEAENLTKEHIQLLIGRVGEGSSLWLDGDVKQQDDVVFERNSGISVAVDRLKGHPRFGYVKLQKTERSETAAMADLLD